jgi:hypothetical protein
VEIRRLHLIRDRIYAEGGLPAKATAVSRVAASAVIVNPFTGQAKEDLSILIAYGATLGEQLSKEAIAFLNRPVVSYGKAAIVGTGGILSTARRLCIRRWGCRSEQPSEAEKR